MTSEPKGTIRIGVIGVGGRGNLAIHAHQPEKGIYVVAGADLNPVALDNFKTRFGYGCFITNTWENLVTRSDLDAIMITSPDYLHEQQAIAALESGKAVYLEKPMAITIEGCDRILETAFRTRSKLYVGHNMRHMSFVQKMKDLIDAGTIGIVKVAWCRHFVAYGGDAYFKDWHAERKNVTGLLLQKATHDIDVLHWLCGGYTVRVNAMGGLTLYNQVTERRSIESKGDPSFCSENWPPLAQQGLSPIIDVEDVSAMNMEFDNGVYATYQQCHYTPDAWRNYTIIGTEGRIENFGDDPPNCWIRVWNQRTGYMEKGDREYHVQVEAGTHGGADPKIVEEFLQYVCDGKKTLTSPIAARNSVAAGYLATQSLRQGGIPFEIPPVEQRYLQYFS
jgi:predicted dehydrogenase